MKRTFLALLMTVAILLINASSVFACSCVDPYPPQESLEISTAVFAGKVISIDYLPAGIIISGADPVKITFEVSRVWKGPEYKNLIITTVRSSATCGYTFELETEYLVYADGKENDLTTTICSRTKPITGAKEDLEQLGEGNAPSIDGSNQNHSSGFATIISGGIAISILIIVIILRRKKSKK
ncbi:MAG: hypothetical protein ABIG84_07930 [archaeon]